MNKERSRRDFLKQISIAAAAPLLFGCRKSANAQRDNADVLQAIKSNALDSRSNNWCGADGAPAGTGFKTVLASEGERGQRIKIYGTVFENDGRTPAKNILIYTYHTDTEGIYGRRGNEHAHGRFRGWVLSDTNGRYEIETIKPGAYPTGRTPAHIHFTLTGENFSEDWIDSIWFKGDKLITDEFKNANISGKGGFDPILTLVEGDRGVLTGRRDILLA